jgi:hypothetical protein
MYGGWTGRPPAQSIDVASSVRFASGLEARYIVAEADGPGAAMLTFVNGRRASVGKPPVNLDGAALVTDFRMQLALAGGEVLQVGPRRVCRISIG